MDPHVAAEFFEGICGHAACKYFERSEDRVMVVGFAARAPRI